MDNFIGEIRAFGFGFAPRGWAQCDGRLLSIAQNTALFSILGTNFGGDGRTTFGLPNLTGTRMPIGAGAGPGLTPREVGEQGGVAAVTLLPTEVPPHNHTLSATASPADVSSPTAQTVLARSTGKPAYAPPGTPAPLNPAATSLAPGGGAPHNNLMPYLVVNYCIALQGTYPPRG